MQCICIVFGQLAMSEGSVITLLSDFGLRDVYVGVMKGVMAKINPQAQLIDLSHEIAPQNIAAGRFCLMNAHGYFPPGTIHLAVVDPGVGSKRRAVAVQFAGGYLVGPDNGLLSGVLSLSAPLMVVELTERQYWRTPEPSNTFHGRDIFAPVAAHLSRGIPLYALGDVIAPESLASLPLADWQVNEAGMSGCIQYIDRFGNLITNIPQSALRSSNWGVKVGDLLVIQGQTYNDVSPGGLIALIGSHGWLEIAVNQGSAKLQLGLNIGDRVLIVNQ